MAWHWVHYLRHPLPLCPQREDLNQYWYSAASIQAVVGAWQGRAPRALAGRSTARLLAPQTR